MALAQDPVTARRFLCVGPQVDDLGLHPSGDRFIVTVQLTEAASREWAAFTTHQVARRVQVKLGSHVLVEARVQTPIESGVLEIARPDQVSAEALRTVIQGAPESPCGADGRGTGAHVQDDGG